jgi:predicted transcriptional regulator
MALKRDFMNIAFNTLRIIGNDEQKPTRIMYRANLSWNTLLDVLAFLEKKGLISCKWTRTPLKGNRLYTLTDKGLVALDHYEALQKLIEEKPIVSD